jgi:hypothetical protein
MRLLGDGVMSGYICIWCIMVKMEAFNMIFKVPKPQFIALSHGYMPGFGSSSRRPPVGPKRSSTIDARTIYIIWIYIYVCISRTGSSAKSCRLPTQCPPDIRY